MTSASQHASHALVRQTSDAHPVLAIDLPDLRIGIAEYDEGPTGCTVFAFDRPTLVATDVRGGLPGVFMAGDGLTDAICFAGGSLYGLAACTSVAAGLLEANGHGVGFEQIAVIRGAILYDFGGRANAVYPDNALGLAALAAARSGAFPPGRRGAGRNTSCGSGPAWDGAEPAGQGAAALARGGLRMAVFVVVNALGMIHARDGRVVRGGLDPATGTRHSYAELLAELGDSAAAPAPTLGHTTLTLVVTNAVLELAALRQLGRQVHSALGRAIQPFHTAYDGDVLFVASTGAHHETTLDAPGLDVLASELAWDAVLRAVGIEPEPR
jgi:L-aminopeptidase/D-esterase-like protein